jgi:PLAC8 family
MTSTIATNKTILVVAPATLEEDFTFDVTLGGKHGNRPFTVTVPKGGVNEGEEFEIPYPGSDSDERSSAAYSEDNDDEEKRTLPCRSSSRDLNDDDEATSDSTTGAPIGRWRNHICACCDVVTQATFWTALVCSPILIAQLVTRLRLTYRGKPALSATSPTTQTVFGDAQEEESLSYNKIVLSFVAVLCVGNFLLGIGLAVVAVYTVLLMVYVGSNIRHSMRQRYKISTLKIFQVCSKSNNRLRKSGGGGGAATANAKSNLNNVNIGGRLEDCLCMLCCGCCSLIQMARHTHNDKEYPGYCCTTTGLEVGAPKIV